MIDDLKALVTGEVDASAEGREAASRDTSLYRVLPEVVVRPMDAPDIQKLVRFATDEQKQGHAVSLTARSAGTDMSGGPLSSSIVLDMTKHFNRVIGVGDSYAVVEPGVYFRDFDKETKKKNLELPSYTASREICTVGGMVANNSGGEKNLKFGKTARYVQELDVVMADGEVHTLKNLEGEALTRKLGEAGYEGDVYRAISSLLVDGASIIKEHAPVVGKNSSGYALWAVGDGVKSLNLARLMVGAQGTLGIITKIRFGLVQPKKYSSMVVVFLNDLKELGTVIQRTLLYEPDSFESYDDNTFTLATKYFPELAVQMRLGFFKLGISFLPEVFMLLTGGIPKLVLMAEFRADTQEAALLKAETLAAEIKKEHPHMRVRVAKNEAAARKYWVVRRESFSLLRKKVRGKRTAPFIDDFVVPPPSLPEFLPKLEVILNKYDLVHTIAGHVGDGNFHIIPLMDPKRPDGPAIIQKLGKEVYDLVLSYHGSISGEHNDGLVRTPYVEQMFGPEMYALFVKVKKIIDPLNIFNPGKKVGSTYAQSAVYLDLGK
jgi:FAD/FMN-containing dehydrogenase